MITRCTPQTGFANDTGLLRKCESTIQWKFGANFSESIVLASLNEWLNALCSALSHTSGQNDNKLRLASKQDSQLPSKLKTLLDHFVINLSLQPMLYLGSTSLMLNNEVNEFVAPIANIKNLCWGQLDWFGGKIKGRSTDQVHQKSWVLLLFSS